VNDVMNIEELRAAIWDYLFQARDTKTIDEIAAVAEQEAAAVRGAVEHKWFSVVDGRVSIAYVKPSWGSHR
jgi:hypothetical protein